MGIGAAKRMYQLTKRNQVTGLMGLVALAAGLFGCGTHTSSNTTTTTTAATASSEVTQAPSAAPGVVASGIPAASGVPASASSIDGTIVHDADLAAVTAAVNASGLLQLDKNRFAAFLDDHAGHPNAYEGKTVREVINLQISYEVGLRLAAQARADDEKHRAEIAGLITPKIALAQERERSLVLHLDLLNLTAKPIKSIELSLEFDNPKTGARIGITEVALVRNIPGKGRIAFDYPMRYLRFGEDTGAMVAARGTPKKLIAQVTEIKYADGSDAGFDD